jgi:transposase
MAAALCYGVRGGGAQLAFHITPGNYDADTLIEVLGELRRFLGGEKATLLWDGLPAHRSHAMRAWLATQRSWLVVERLPAYAPELNPVEGLWSSLKAVELANLTSPTLAEVIDQAHQGIERVRRAPHLAYSFLRHRSVGLLNINPTQIALSKAAAANPPPACRSGPGRRSRPPWSSNATRCATPS